MPASIPPSIQPMLDEYLTLVQTTLPDLMVGCYLHGSVVLDAFVPSLSDVDFITVVSHPITDTDFAALTVIHRTLEQKYPHAPLQGSYLQMQDLGKFAQEIQRGPSYSDGVLDRARHNDINSITWWLLKHKGITLAGPAAQELDFSVDWDLLVANTRINMNSYWAAYTRQPARIAWLFSDYGVQWAVSGVLRQWYTFEAHDIASKVGACEYALTCLPERWHRIIQEAIALRLKQPSLYRVRLLRALDAWLFLRFLIAHCNAMPLGAGTP